MSMNPVTVAPRPQGGFTMVGTPSAAPRASGPGILATFRAIMARAVADARDPERPLNKAVGLAARGGDRLLETVLGSFAVLDPHALAQAPPNYLGQAFPRLHGEQRTAMNAELHRYGHLAQLDSLLLRHRNDDAVKAIEHAALVNPRAAADRLINWYGGLGRMAPDSEFYNEEHEKVRVRW